MKTTKNIAASKVGLIYALFSRAQEVTKAPQGSQEDLDLLAQQDLQ